MTRIVVFDIMHVLKEKIWKNFFLKIRAQNFLGQVYPTLNLPSGCAPVAKVNVIENNTFVSGLFTRSKKDGSKRMIFNLKGLNKICRLYKHFKMESKQNVSELIRPGI